MNRHQHRKVVLTSIALGLGATIALSGCGTGQETQTSSQVAAVNGASETVQDIAIRDAQFPFPTEHPYYPKGSSAPIQTVVSNNGGTTDKLVRVSSPYAPSVDVSGTTTLAPYSAVHANPGPQPGTEAATSDQQRIQITLRDFNREIGPGVTVPVKFTFEKAGSVTVQVPIGADPKPRPPESVGGGH